MSDRNSTAARILWRAAQWLTISAMVAMAAVIIAILTFPRWIGPVDRVWSANRDRIWAPRAHRSPAKLQDLIRSGPGHHSPRQLKP